MLKYYTDMVTRTGLKRTHLRYFLTDLGGNHLILRYPWFASAQPKIDWAKGWIDYSQLLSPLLDRSPLSRIVTCSHHRQCHMLYQVTCIVSHEFCHVIWMGYMSKAIVPSI